MPLAVTMMLGASSQKQSSTSLWKMAYKAVKNAQHRKLSGVVCIMQYMHQAQDRACLDVSLTSFSTTRM